MKKNNLFLWCKQNGEFGKKLLNEWTGLDEHNIEHNITEITKGSHIRMKWHCNICNKNWIVDIHNRTGYKTNCPYCSEDNRSYRSMKAKTICGENDLLT